MERKTDMCDSDSSDCQIEEQNLPTAAECEERCQRFAAVTGTDTALAMFFLQDREEGENIVPPTEKSDSEPHRIRLLSWNIDGLDNNNVKTRAKAVVNTINSEKPHVVFVQEMVPSNEAVLREGLTNYQAICGGTGSKEGYYTGIFLQKQHTILEDYQIKPFFSSQMARSLLIASCLVKGVPMTLITSHLESTKNHAEERKRQLISAFKHIEQAPQDHTVVFGGDLNLRDKELESIGGIPSGIVDLWETTGRRKEARSTWDTFRNDNLGYEGHSRAALRFDRLYMRPAKPAPKIKAVYFELVGLQRVPDIMRFPSDHWGILAHFDILP
ncbi:hypothetical protein C0Q70_07656 [Pomacea canaliculata]|uniref:Tyrosyl-DNA phosphodiesterase 2 n=1 Tax=Pomacea canaliculata TaxID=400727 RepID=A0A2T7PFM7_POMCA|nr:hypothetical protein C0Q70_07656 [Pomacea canaliculata]